MLRLPDDSEELSIRNKPFITVIWLICVVHAMGRHSSTRGAPTHLERCLALRDREPVALPPRPTGHRLARRIDDADRKTIVATCITGGTNLTQLAERYGVSDYLILRTLRKAGIPPQRRRVTAEQAALVHELQADGLKIDANAEEVAIKQASVQLIIAGYPRAGGDD